MEKVNRIKNLLKELKDKGYVNDVKHLSDLAKRLKNFDEKKLRHIEEATKTVKPK